MNKNRFNSPCSLQKSKQLLYFGAQHVQQWDHHGWLHVLGRVVNSIAYNGISHFHWSGLGRENSIFVFHVQAAHGICFHGITGCQWLSCGLNFETLKPKSPRSKPPIIAQTGARLLIRFLYFSLFFFFFLSDSRLRALFSFSLSYF